MAKHPRPSDSRRPTFRRECSKRLALFPFGLFLEALEARRLLTSFINEFGGSAVLTNPTGITSGPDQNLWFTESNANSPGIAQISPSGAIFEYTFGLSSNSTPTGITDGPDDALWFTDPGANQIGRIDTSGNITEFNLPTTGSDPDQITVGSNGNLWFTEPGINSIGEITTSGVVTQFTIPTLDSGPSGITSGPDGAVWFTESTADQIGRITTSGNITEFSTGISPTSDPVGITTDDFGNLWFTQNATSQIGRITPEGVVTEFSTGITDGSGPLSIASGSNENLWFTEQNDNKIGEISISGFVTEFDAPSSPNASLDGIASGPDGNLWYTDEAGNFVDRISLFGVSTQFPSPTNVLAGESDPNGITTGPDDALWFTETSSGNIGRIDPSGNISEYPVGGAPISITLGPVPTGGGQANLWFTDDDSGYYSDTGAIEEINTDGTVVGNYSTPAQYGMPGGITLGPDGNLWFTLSGSDDTPGIGMITPAGVITVFTDGLAPTTSPEAITTGPDQALWFTASTLNGGEIGRIVPPMGTDPNPTITTYPITNDTAEDEQSSPLGIVAGTGNELWFADYGNSAIGMITTAGVVTEYNQGLTSSDVPTDVALGADGNIYFTDPIAIGEDPVGQITPSGTITLYQTTTPSAEATGIAAGPDNNIWFTEPGANQIGQLVLPESVTGLTAESNTVYATIPADLNDGSFSDLSSATNSTNFLAMFDYGDGSNGPADVTSPYNFGEYEVVSGHTYTTPGTYPATLTVYNATGTLSAFSNPIIVLSPITLAGFTVQGTAGTRSNTNVGGFNDVDTSAVAGDFIATIAWGDGSADSTANILDSFSMSYAFNLFAGHVYTSSGTFDGTIMLVDNRNGLTSTASFSAVIAAAPSQTVFNEVGPIALTPGSEPTGITLGPDGALWFTEPNTGEIGRIDTSGNVTQFVPTTAPPQDGSDPAVPGPDEITLGPDGNLWFTDPDAGAIGRVTTKGVFTFFTTGITAGSQPTGITSGPDGALWFTETDGNQIGRISTSGVVTEYSSGLPTGYDPDAITLGTDGNLWFVGIGSSEIGRITPQGLITLNVGTGSTYLTSITSGPDGNLWFTDPQAGMIGKINPTTFQVTEYTGSAIISPEAIVSGPDGDLYFVSGLNNSVGRITTQGISTAFSTGLTASSDLQGIATGPDGNVDFTETDGDRIGQLVLPQSSVSNLSFDPPNSVQGTTISGSLGSFDEASSLPTTANFLTEINWGDGTPLDLEPSIGGQSAFTSDGTHTYAEPGTYHGTYEVFNSAGSMTVAFSIQIAPAITVTGIPIQAEADRSINQVVATFKDASSTQSTNSYLETINWGDGTTTNGTIPNDDTGDVHGTHTYASPGTYTVTTTIQVSGEPDFVGTGTSFATITPLVSVLNASGTTINATLGTPFNGNVASFVNTNPDESMLPASAYSATINWGDGSALTPGTIEATTIPGRFEVGGDHSYAAIGQFQVIVSISLIDQPDTATATSPATVISGTIPLSFVVTNTLDSGPGSLRQAIINANQVGGHQITFAIPNADLNPEGVGTIAPVSPLPVISFTTFLDGTSQGLFEHQSTGNAIPSTPLVEIDGRGVGGTRSGLVFSGNSGGSELADLSVFGFGGAEVELDSPGDLVWGNYIGLRADGTVTSKGTPSPIFSANGILVQAPDAIIGGLGAGQRNVISGNAGQGIEINGSLATSVGIFGNLIGLDPTGSVGLGNGINGIAVLGGAGHEFIGPSNLISGNAGDGIVLLGSSSDLITGNAIGTDLTVSRSIANGSDGILIDDASTSVTIGGTVGGTTNFLSGNGSVGIVIQGGSSQNLVEGNLIGTNRDGSAAIGNGIAGILISNAPSNVIGLGNLISGNGSVSQGAGIWIEGASATGNAVFGNRIGTNLDGEAAIPNAVIGVLINDAPDNQIGGSGLDGNQISGNSEIGVMIAGQGATGNLLFGNLIGTDALGAKAIPNATGVFIDDAPGNTIGAITAGHGNVISGNSADGIQVFDTGSTGNLVQGNSIGTNLTATRPLGNGGNGILINGAPGTKILDDFIDSNLENGIFVSGAISTGTLIQTSVIGRGSGGQRLGNAEFGLLIGNGAPAPTQVGNLNVNNTLGPIRNSSQTPVTTRATKASKVKVKVKSDSFADRALTSLQSTGQLKSKKKA
jgi:streptogramin lyase